MKMPPKHLLDEREAFAVVPSPQVTFQQNIRPTLETTGREHNC